MSAAAPRPQQPGGRRRTGGVDYALMLVYAMWVLRLMEPEWYVYRLIGGPFYWIPTLLAPVLLFLALQRFSPRQLYWPLVVFTVMHLFASILAENSGLARGGFKFLLHTLILFMATVAIVDTPSKVLVLLKLFLVGFLWYGIQGVSQGKVLWHPLLGNEDSYGPLMVIGFGFGYYFGLAARPRLWRRLGLATAALGVVGVVVSFARGAALSAGATAFAIWLRSPHKLRALAAGIGAILLALGAVTVMFPAGEFWDEMSTIQDGGEHGTGQGRLIIWQLAMDVYASNPVFGVGAGNCGVWMAKNIAYDPRRAQFSNPETLYTTAAHNDYVTLVCEEGTVGAVAFIAILIGFVLRLRFIRTKAALRAWDRDTGRSFDLRYISWALELGMVAYLTSAFFYNQLYIHWFWTLFTLTYVLEGVLRTHAGRIAAEARAAARRPAPPPLPAAPAEA